MYQNTLEYTLELIGEEEGGIPLRCELVASFHKTTEAEEAAAEAWEAHDLSREEKKFLGKVTT